MKNFAFIFCIFIAVTAIVTFVSCHGNDPSPDPTPKVTDAWFENQANLDSIAQIYAATQDPTKFVRGSFVTAARLPVRSADMAKLTQLSQILDMAKNSKCRFDVNSAMLMLAEKIILSDAQCDALVVLWKQYGLTFVTGSNGAFCISSAQASKFTAEMLLNLFYTDARPVSITKAEELQPMCAQVSAWANAGQQVIVTVGPFSTSADSLVYLRQLWHPNIRVTMNPGITANITRHPTEPYILNSLYGMTGAPINVVVPNNPKALGGLNATCVDDTTFALMRTAVTADKADGTYRANVVGSDGNLINPIIGTYCRFTDYSPAGGISADGVKMIPFDVSKVFAGTYGNEDGSYYMTAASFMGACGGQIPNDPQKLPCLLRTHQNILLTLSSDPKYQGIATQYGASFSGMRIAYKDFSKVSGQAPLVYIFQRPTASSVAGDVTLAAGKYILETDTVKDSGGWSEWEQIASGTIQWNDVLNNAKKRMNEEVTVQEPSTIWPEQASSNSINSSKVLRLDFTSVMARSTQK